MASALFKAVLAEVKPETTVFIKQYLDLVERINDSTLEEEEIKVLVEQLLQTRPFSEDEG